MNISRFATIPSHHRSKGPLLAAVVGCLLAAVRGQSQALTFVGATVAGGGGEGVGGNYYERGTIGFSGISRFGSPLILSAPTNLTALCGDSITLSAPSLSVSGSAPFSYQWLFSDSPLSGATNSSYGFTASGATAGSYKVIITNAYGAATSTLANVTVLDRAPPAFTIQPQSQVCLPGSQINFDANAVACVSVNYQWRFNGSNVGGATNSNFTLQNVTANQSGRYDVLATNVAGVVTSAVAVLTVHEPPIGSDSWVRRYSEPGTNSAVANAVAVDASGNVFVTGYSVATNGLADYVTIAYSSAGVALWTNKYNGSGNGDDQAVAIAVKGNGNVIVTGQSFGSGGYYDYATIAYSGSGVPLWTNIFTANNSDAKPSAVAVDGGGNVCVTGSSLSGSAYATIAYSSMGVPLRTNIWSYLYSPTMASALALDDSGNVYVTGQASQSVSHDPEYATLAYSGTGVPLWTNFYDPGAASAVAVDSKGDIFVTGSGYVTIAYSNTGVPLWTNSYSGPSGDDNARDIAVDDDGNVYVTGVSQDDSSLTMTYATVAFSGDGTCLWTNLYSGPGDTQLVSVAAVAVAVDSKAHILYVTGYSTGIGSDYDYATVAYSTTGLALWTNRYNGPANGPDQPQTKGSLAVGPDGSVYVTGSSQSDASTGKTDFATGKYTSAVPPMLIVQPQGGAFNAGATDKVSVAACASPPASYQWLLNGSPIPGATNSDYSFSVSAATVGRYLAVATNIYGAVTSSVATVRLPETSFTENFDGLTVPPNLEVAAGYVFGTNSSPPGKAQNTSGNLSYIRTVADNYATLDFTFQVTVSVTNGFGLFIAFVGIGSGLGDPAYSGEPGGSAYLGCDFVTHFGGELYFFTAPGFGAGHNGVAISPNSLLSGGTHRVQIQKQGDVLSFGLHLNYAGGPFVATYSTNLSLSANLSYLNATNSHLFFGTMAPQITFDDLFIAVAGFNRLRLELLNNGQANLGFLGNPGLYYALDWTHSLNPPVTWLPLTTNQAATDGSILFTNTPSPAPTNDFYRTRYVTNAP
jgi:hypothetical protein